jgi:hypothetical protein
VCIRTQRPAQSRNRLSESDHALRARGPTNQQLPVRDLVMRRRCSSPFRFLTYVWDECTASSASASSSAVRNGSQSEVLASLGLLDLLGEDKTQVRHSGPRGAKTNAPHLAPFERRGPRKHLSACHVLPSQPRWAPRPPLQPGSAPPHQPPALLPRPAPFLTLTPAGFTAHKTPALALAPAASMPIPPGPVPLAPSLPPQPSLPPKGQSCPCVC